MHERRQNHERKVATNTFDVDAQGAYVTRLVDKDGVAILAPLAILGVAQKKRGGSHVCLPYFGPDAQARPQHGFGRNLEWRIEATDNGVTAFFEKDVPGWEGFRAMIEYISRENQFTMKLTVVNGTKVAQRVSPGFHPYFALSGNSAVLDGVQVSANAYGEAQMLEGPIHTLKTDTHFLTLQSEEMQTWAVWSDRLGDYLCVEPTFRGMSFATGTEPLDGEIIESGQKKDYTFTISWYSS